MPTKPAARASSIARLEDARLVRELAADVDVGAARPDGVGADQGAFEELVRVLLADQPVLEGAGLALVGVHAQVLRLVGGLGDEAPLRARGEARAAAAAQTRPLDQIDDLLGRLLQRHRQRLVPAVLLVDRQRVRVGQMDRLREHRLEGRGGGRHQRSTSPSTMSMLPMQATTSATIRPRHMSSSAWRLMSEGGRTRVRCGIGRAVAHDVEAQLALGRLDREVRVARGRGCTPPT